MIKLLKHDNILYQCLIEKLLKSNFQTFFLAKCLFIKTEIKPYNMKKYILLILPLFFILLNSNAQKSSIILRGGLNLANVTISENGRVDDAKNLTSFQAGFIGDLNLGQFIS